MSAPKRLPIGFRSHAFTVIETGLRKPAAPSIAWKHPDGCRPAVRVRCDCGQERVHYEAQVHAGAWRSCGCMRRNRSHGPRNKTHGLRRHPLYQTWWTMVRRCTRPGPIEEHHYSDVEVYPDWIETPTAFVAWVEANLGERPKGQSLDRINPAGHYVPGNLRWATAKLQRHNRRAA